MKKSRVVAMVAGALLSGCALPLTLVPLSQPIPSGKSYRVIKDVEGSACRRDLLFIIPLGFDQSIYAAEQDALSSATGADALVDISIDRTWRTYIIYNSYCTIIHAKAVKFE